MPLGHARRNGARGRGRGIIIIIIIIIIIMAKPTQATPSRIVIAAPRAQVLRQYAAHALTMRIKQLMRTARRALRSLSTLTLLMHALILSSLTLCMHTPRIVSAVIERGATRCCIELTRTKPMCLGCG